MIAQVIQYISSLTIQVFSRDIVPILQLAAIFLLWLQIRTTSRWNKLTSQYAHMNIDHMKLEDELHNKAKKAGVILKARSNPLTDGEVEKLWNDDDAYSALLSYLNDLEGRCAAIRAGVVDKQLSYVSYSHMVIGSSEKYSAVFAKMRALYDDKEVFMEIDALAKEWRKKNQSTKLWNERLMRWFMRNNAMKKKV